MTRLLHLLAEFALLLFVLVTVFWLMQVVDELTAEPAAQRLECPADCWMVNNVCRANEVGMGGAVRCRD